MVERIVRIVVGVAVWEYLGEKRNSWEMVAVSGDAGGLMVDKRLTTPSRLEQ